jgi:hypothetical protein
LKDPKSANESSVFLVFVASLLLRADVKSPNSSSSSLFTGDSAGKPSSGDASRL